MKCDGASDLARSGRLYPSVIVHGGTADGRQTFALELARTLLCERTAGQRPCGECRHCRRIRWPGEEDVFHPDFSVLLRDMRTVTSVGATKDFLRPAQVSPFEARGQVFVVASADTLSGEAANALLKTLEEPPVSAPRHFFLLTPSQLDLLPTLRSRSLALFLGTTPRPRRDDLTDAIGAFEQCLEAHGTSGSAAELQVAAAALMKGASWEDPRSAEPWERAAAVVAAAAEDPGAESASRRPALLALATDLLSGPRLRVRGIKAERILEGMLARRLG